MENRRVPKGPHIPQMHRQPDQPASKRLPLPAHQENLMRLQGMIGNQAVQRMMVQRQIEIEEMEVPVEGESADTGGPMVLDEMEVPVEGGTDDSGAITRPDGVVEFPPDHGPNPDGKEAGPAAPKNSTDDSGAKVGPDGTLEFPPDHVPAEGEPTVGPDGELQFPPDHIPAADDSDGGWMKDMLPFF